MEPKSMNKWNTVLTMALGLVFGLFSLNGAAVGVDPDAFMTSVTSLEGISLISFLLVKLGGPVYKVYVRIKEGRFVWKDRNMFLHAASLAAAVVAVFVKDAAFIGFITAALIEAVNYIWHKVEPSK